MLLAVFGIVVSRLLEQHYTARRLDLYTRQSSARLIGRRRQIRSYIEISVQGHGRGVINLDRVCETVELDLGDRHHNHNYVVCSSN
jgi:hypothetical protein